ncbi:MAG: copper transporter [Arcanobacterium sp.]
MVEFRYHILTIGAIFLALAVGIILGAGPLQDSIVRALNSQVESLSDTNAELKAENIMLAEENARHNEAIEAIAPFLTEGALADREIGIVILPGSTEEAVQSVRQRLADAGAQVNVEVSLAEGWSSETAATARDELAEQLRPLLPSLTPDASTTIVLSTALDQVLRNGSDSEIGAPLAGYLMEFHEPLVEVSTDLGLPVEAVVVIAPDTDDVGLEEVATDDSAVLEHAQRDAESYVELISQFAATGPTVAAGAADSATDVVRQLRNAGIDASTVDNIPSGVGSINIVVAIANELNGMLVHLGYEDGASAGLGERAEAPREVIDPEVAEQGTEADQNVEAE